MDTKSLVKLLKKSTSRDAKLLLIQEGFRPVATAFKPKEPTQVQWL